jgi:hypothetical protein
MISECERREYNQRLKEQFPAKYKEGYRCSRDIGWLLPNGLDKTDSKCPVCDNNLVLRGLGIHLEINKVCLKCECFFVVDG